MKCDNQVVLLITGCITPEDGVPFLMLKDSSIRATQTYDAIKFFLTDSPFLNIVYCDNSCAQENPFLMKLAEKEGKKLEWLSFQGDKKSIVAKGKGFGEGEIIKYAIDNSQILSDDVFFVKITGRLIVSNIRFLLQKMKKEYMYFDHSVYLSRCNTVIYGLTVSEYSMYFRNALFYVDDCKGIDLETIFGHIISKHKLKTKTFFVYPDIIGVSGTSGGLYTVSKKEIIKKTFEMYDKRYFRSFFFRLKRRIVMLIAKKKNMVSQ